MDNTSYYNSSYPITEGVSQRELPQVRQAELRVRAAWSSRARAAVPVDPVGGSAQDGRPAARGGRGGEGPPGLLEELAGVRLTARETAGRDGKGEDGRARTREVKLAVFFTQDKLDKDGYPVRDRASTSVIATFEPASVFAGLVRAEGHPARRGPRPPVDLYHAREHLHDLARSMEFMLGDRKDEWLAARLAHVGGVGLEVA